MMPLCQDKFRNYGSDSYITVHRGTIFAQLSSAGHWTHPRYIKIISNYRDSGIIQLLAPQTRRPARLHHLVFEHLQVRATQPHHHHLGA
jgi:hypothetical protein